MLTVYDYGVVGCYLAFMFALGWVFQSLNKDTSDYFRGSGSQLWWLVGASAFMQQFSALTFTGFAGRAYETGSLVAMVFLGNAGGFLVSYLVTARRFRQMRVITPVEAIRERFGPANEQFFTWISVPIQIAYAGIWLNALGVFTAAVFGVDLRGTILVVGGVVVLMSVTGGAWAATASDFIQMLILMVITLVAAVLALAHPAVGGLEGLLTRTPPAFFDWTEGARGWVVVLWIAGTLTKQMFSINNLIDSSRYLGVKNGAQASRAALLAFGLMLLGPLIWFIPPMAAAVVAPDLSGHFPGLAHPEEAAYVFMAKETLPTGMMGLLLCGILAATMSSMDSGLNRNAGIFVRNFYRPVLRPGASEAHLLGVGKGVSLTFGLLIIGTALFLTELKHFKLFDIMLLFGGLIALPSQIPLTLGVFFRRTPGWSGWSTVLVGFAVSLLVTQILAADRLAVFWPGAEGLSRRESNDLLFFAGVLLNILICGGWFFATSLFYGREKAERRQEGEAFFAKMARPLDPATEGGRDLDARQAHLMGWMTMGYGGFVLALAAVPQPHWGGRLAFVAVGGFSLLIGILLYYSVPRQAHPPAVTGGPPG